MCGLLAYRLLGRAVNAAMMAAVVVMVAATAARAEPVTIVVLGDSLTAGHGLALKSDAFPAQLQAALVDQGVDALVINAGVSGDTSAGGLARLIPFSSVHALHDALLSMHCMTRHLVCVPRGGRPHPASCRVATPCLAPTSRAKARPGHLERARGSPISRIPSGPAVSVPQRKGRTAVSNRFSPCNTGGVHT